MTRCCGGIPARASSRATSSVRDRRKTAACRWNDLANDKARMTKEIRMTNDEIRKNAKTRISNDQYPASNARVAPDPPASPDLNSGFRHSFVIRHSDLIGLPSGTRGHV